MQEDLGILEGETKGSSLMRSREGRCLGREGLRGVIDKPAKAVVRDIVRIDWPAGSCCAMNEEVLDVADV